MSDDSAASDFTKETEELPTSSEEIETDAVTSTLSGTESIAESIVGCINENGRRYHCFGDDKVYLPNDEKEQDRLDLRHHHCLMALGGLYTAPIIEPERILDCGTGTGIWATDMAEEFPEAEVIGVDITPIQPTWVPPNVNFEIDDLTLDWTFPENHFDFIHSRDMTLHIQYWEDYANQMFRCCKPGGYVELIEAELHVHCDDDSYDPDTALHHYMTAFHNAVAHAEVVLPTQKLLTDSLRSAGFIRVQVKPTRVPWGTWPDDPARRNLGAVGVAILESGLESYSLRLLTEELGFSADEVRELCQRAMEEIRTNKVRVYQNQWQITAQKRPEQK